MDSDDKERLVRIETILEKTIAPQLESYGPHIRKLEQFKTQALVVWSAAGVGALIFKDAAAEWLKNKMLPH